jgi:hypothetical protein
MNIRQIRDLQDRISKLGGGGINKNRRPLYRYQHKGLDPAENEAWRMFVEMQLTALDFQELRTIDIKRRELGYASIVQPNPPEKVSLDRSLYDRRVALLEVAELRAEEILEQQAERWYSWLSYFQEHVWPEMQKHITTEVHDDETAEYILDFKLRHWDVYKALSRSES